MSVDQPSPKWAAVSRDTIALIAALFFLVLAVGLTFLTSPQNPGNGSSAEAAAALTVTVSGTTGSTAVARRERPTLSPSSTGVQLSVVQRQDDDSNYPDPYPGDEENDDGVVDGEDENYPYPAEETPEGFDPTVTSEEATAGAEMDDGTVDGEAVDGQPTIGGVNLGTTVINAQSTAAAAASSLAAVTPFPTQTPFPTSTPLPTTPPARILTGVNRWSTADSPILLDQDLVLAPNAELIIEPGVEVRLAPAASIYLDGGRLLAVGSPTQRITFTGLTGARWGGIFARPGSFLALENVVVRGGGIGGTVLMAEEAGMVLRYTQITDNGGGVIAYDALLRLEYVEIAGNDVPYGAALDISYLRGNGVTLVGNRIAGNRLGVDSPMVRVIAGNPNEVLSIEMEGNLIRGGSPNLALNVETHMQGTIVCNTLVGDGPGISLRSSNPQVGPNGRLINDLRIARNLIDDHVPPVVPIYLTYGLGRGAISDVGLDMRNNYWGDAGGPYQPDENPEGRGDSVGSSILYKPWLQSPPACAPGR